MKIDPVKLKYDIKINRFREKINNLYKKDYELIKQLSSNSINSNFI